MTKFRKPTLDDLKNSCLDQKAAEVMQIRDVSPDEMASIFRNAYIKLNKPAPKNLPKVWAYEIPYFDPDGKLNGFCRYKLLEEYTPQGAKKSVKYLQLTGTKPRFYFPPFCDWSKIAVNSDDLYIVEGEKKAAALTLLGSPAIGLSGVWGWKSKEDESSEVISDFNHIKLVNRKTIIVFDADV
ncbi:MAG: DUF3854 domain-containing protein [Alphaproteobacteria bacterium]